MECICGMVVDKEDNFCRGCGSKIEKKEEIPFIGEFKKKGIYQITFNPIEDQFEDQEQAEDKARHSAWGEDREFKGFRVKKIKSTVTKKTHPYICDACNVYVAEEMNGRCSGCGKKNWKCR